LGVEVTHDTRRRRVGAELHRLLNELLLTEVKDPRLDEVTVSEVEMSGDLGVAKVFFATLDPDADVEDAHAGFRAASGFLRGRIGQALRLRRTPELLFHRDESARRGAELTRLIDSLAVDSNGEADETGEIGRTDETGETDDGALGGDAPPDEDSNAR
jgi:ribosome-binding factor A